MFVRRLCLASRHAQGVHQTHTQTEKHYTGKTVTAAKLEGSRAAKISYVKVYTAPLMITVLCF